MSTIAFAWYCRAILATVSLLVRAGRRIVVVDDDCLMENESESELEKWREEQAIEL